MPRVPDASTLTTLPADIIRATKQQSLLVAPTTRIGPYVIESAIGAGGMGEVYRARDTKLDRDVALKILPEAFASDPERLARLSARRRHSLL